MGLKNRDYEGINIQFCVTEVTPYDQLTWWFLWMHLMVFHSLAKVFIWESADAVQTVNSPYLFSYISLIVGSENWVNRWESIWFTGSQ